jgi:MarR family transcriptional regulator, organic hydroperoxide resistance regulator
MKASGSRFSQCLYFTTNALARKVEKLATDCWKPVDMPPSYAYLLLAVLEEPGIQPSVLCTHLQLTPSTITRLMDKLEERKLLVRTSEGKLTNVYPTPKAKELWPKMKTCMQDFYERYSALLGKEEGAKLAQSLVKIADKL